MPIPPVILKQTSCTKLEQAAHPSAHILNRVAAMSIVFFLPMLSLSDPANITPMIEPMRAHPTYQPCCMVSSENCCVTLPIVPDITAVSYPKSIPPMAEATERKMMYPVLVPACPDDVMILFNFIFNGNKNNENSY